MIRGNGSCGNAHTGQPNRFLFIMIQRGCQFFMPHARRHSPHTCLAPNSEALIPYYYESQIKKLPATGTIDNTALVWPSVRRENLLP